MRKKLVLLGLVITVTGAALAQENLRAQLFGPTDALLADAKGRHADLYAPSAFTQAVTYYNDARESFNKGGKLEEIREDLKNASAYLAKAMDISKLGEVAFSKTMAARTDAESAEAQKSTVELWNKAETQFQSAARELEDGDIASAREKGATAEAFYRMAELEAIKTNFLGPARDLLKRADAIDASTHAPKTMAKAKSLAANVEQLLKQNRYDTDEARQLAQEARYEAAHAIYLTVTIAKMDRDDRPIEDVFLDAEAQIQRLASSMNVVARFDNGFEQAVTELQAALKERDAKVRHTTDALSAAAETIRVQQLQIDNLKKQVSSMEGRLGNLNENEQALQQQLNDQYAQIATQRQQEETIRQVSGIFSEEEGKVFRDGDHVIIRLWGLTFPVGKNIIESQFYPLLTKVQDAIRRFPNCKVLIEGHTDSQGSDETNQVLSESRAKAVAEYLMANMNVELAIDHQGYGESRPVASNDSPEGRAKNRRIDVVITPGWTTIGR